MPEYSIMEVNREALKDIDTVIVDKEKPINEKIDRYISDMGGEPTTHMNEGYVVRVHFSDTDYSATDAMKHYLQKIAELKY